MKQNQEETWLLNSKIQKKKKPTKKKHNRNSLWKPDKKPRIQTNKLIRTTKHQNRPNTTHNSNKPQKNIQQNNRKLKKSDSLDKNNPKTTTK